MTIQARRWFYDEPRFPHRSRSHGVIAIGRIPLRVAIPSVISTEVEKSLALNPRFARKSERCLDYARHDKLSTLLLMASLPLSFATSPGSCKSFCVIATEVQKSFALICRCPKSLATHVT